MLMLYGLPRAAASRRGCICYWSEPRVAGTFRRSEDPETFAAEVATCFGLIRRPTNLTDGGSSSVIVGVDATARPTRRHRSRPSLWLSQRTSSGSAGEAWAPGGGAIASTQTREPRLRRPHSRLGR